MIAARHQNVKSINKLVEEAYNSGELHLKNRKLKDISICFLEKNLSDLTYADLSYNCLSEIPADICQWLCLHTLNLSYNNIKLASDLLANFCLLEVLDLSGNSITNLPNNIASLETLVVLCLENNKLVSLPNSIGKLKNCQKLNVSGNCLNNLPSEIGNMSSLLHLDISRNSIYNLPDNLSYLHLCYLDASSNKMSSIPISLQNMHELQVVNFDDNPLTCPPLSVLKKGKVHMFKFLLSEAAKNKRHQEIMEPLLLRKRDKVYRSFDNSSENVVESTHQQIISKITSDLSFPVNGDLQNVSSIQSLPVKTMASYKENHQTLVHSNSKADVNPNVVDKSSKQTNHDEHYADKEPKFLDDVVHKAVTPQQESKLPIKKTIPRVSQSNRISIAKKMSFPGYTPPPIKEKPKRKRTSHLHGDNGDQSHYLEIIKPRTAYINKKVQPESENDSSFTIRRKTEKIYEELELLEELRQKIESALKMPLSQDLLSSLSDGVVLCHLANHAKSRAIPTIHVPSPAVPKLSLAKCRKNVDNFLDACSKLGVPQSKLCSAHDIMHGKGLSRIVSTVTDLLKIARQNGSTRREPSFHAHSVRVTPSVQLRK